ncbi:MAG: ATP-binding protein, partial [Actinomycetota bacterium]|nr:ATP-binding protein [Actinomycetota bacterium]
MVVDVDVAEVTLPRQQESVPRSRAFVTEALRAWGLEELIDSATLVCSELVTNALLHGAPPVRLVVRRVGDQVRLEVHDGRRADPVVGRQRLMSSQGRGMALVEMLAAAWGVEPTETGKVVWAQVGAEPEAAEPTLDELEALWGIDEPLDAATVEATDDPIVEAPADRVAELAALV